MIQDLVTWRAGPGNRNIHYHPVVLGGDAAAGASARSCGVRKSESPLRARRRHDIRRWAVRFHFVDCNGPPSCVRCGAPSVRPSAAAGRHARGGWTVSPVDAERHRVGARRHGRQRLVQDEDAPRASRCADPGSEGDARRDPSHGGLREVPRGAASLRAERRRISRELASADRGTVLRVALGLTVEGVPRFVAYEIVLFHKPTIETLGPRTS
jgi:hypothetical protein